MNPEHRSHPDACNPMGDEDGDLSLLFDRNRAWARSKTHRDPQFFRRLVDQQRPRYFWIGCSDSRVPATEIVDLDPGEMFVHRNVANLALAEDPSFAAALQFAIDVLEVQHIIVVGHYGCGGIAAAMGPETNDPVGRWLKPVRRLCHDHLCASQRDTPDANQLCERNVEAQVRALSDNALVQAAWDRGAPLTLHGWIYAIGNGLLHTVCRPIRHLAHPDSGT
jgi:carbonic anhydrase